MIRSGVSAGIPGSSQRRHLMKDLTKIALGESLRKLMAEKPLNKITISDITNECGCNRMTFYYHFHDIYELLEWALEQETAN